MVWLESQSILTNIKPETGVSNLRGSGRTSRFSGFFVGDDLMKWIPLTQGKYAIVDDIDFEDLSKYKWFAYKNKHNFYAARNRSRKIGTQGIIKMHRQILGLKKGDGKQIDHIDGNGLNNQQRNLRLCTCKQNQMNQFASRGSSRYKGVHWCNRNKRWMSRIFFNKQIFLGSFKIEIEAAKVYNKAAIKYFGEFARLNIVGKD